MARIASRLREYIRLPCGIPPTAYGHHLAQYYSLYLFPEYKVSGRFEKDALSIARVM